MIRLRVWFGGHGTLTGCSRHWLNIAVIFFSFLGAQCEHSPPPQIMQLSFTQLGKHRGHHPLCVTNKPRAGKTTVVTVGSLLPVGRLGALHLGHRLEMNTSELWHGRELSLSKGCVHGNGLRRFKCILLKSHG
ncbi:uncharacterized protein LOC144304984 isoform X2 [Canis aureus]